MSVDRVAFSPTLIGIELDPRQGLSKQLYEILRRQILDGRLSSGMRLPASRDLAKSLAISRNSVMRTFDQLYAEGFIEGRIGDGTYVAQLAKRNAALQRNAPGKLSTNLPTGLHTGLCTGLSTFSAGKPSDLPDQVIHNPALQLLEKHRLNEPPDDRPKAFRVGVPAFDLFPFALWGKLYASFWRKPNLDQLGYGAAAGEWRLRELVAAYLRSSRGLGCTAEQIVITSGAQHAISLCAQLLVTPGEGVAVENPGYRAAGHAFALA
ncbi:PLP-dependent aminotransferase family protein, partial [Pseudomonas syringae pv. actinidiae]|nr:PLP-dependent aminotransferase family protein [Pseudomonas syringae pv. actinidiae]